MGKNNEYDFDLIISQEELEKNKLKSTPKTKELELKEKIFIALILLILIIMITGLIKIVDNEEVNTIEKVSERCAKEGLGITAIYSQEGDRNYVCNNK